jgi:putative SOS response-associated peptidase YedK
MCGRAIQSSAPFKLAIVRGINVRANQLSNYPPRYNGAPSQDLLVIRRNRDCDVEGCHSAARALHQINH